MKNNLIKNSKNLMLLTTLSLSVASFAQETENKTTVKGFAEGYYKLDGGRNVSINGKTLYTETHNSFEFGSANLQVEHNSGKAKFFADFGLGKRINDLNTFDGNSTATIVKELYFSYEALEGLNITAGTFQRHFGIEKINAIDNKNYSMSYAYSFSPLLNTGIKFNYKIEGLNVMVGATNAADFKSAVAANTTQKTIIAQIGYTTDNSNISVNYQTASHNPSNINNLTLLNMINHSIYNLTFKQKLDDKLSVAVDANLFALTPDGKNSKTSNVVSVAGYVSYKVKDNFGLNYRLEYFDDKDKTNFINVSGGNIISNTISGKYNLGNLTLVPEVRADFASEKVFLLGNKTSQINPSFLVAAIYNF